MLTILILLAEFVLLVLRPDNQLPFLSTQLCSPRPLPLFQYWGVHLRQCWYDASGACLIVINSKNFDQFWLLWSILINDNCEKCYTFKLWTIGTIINSCVCLGQLSTILKNCDNIDYIVSRGLSLTSCQSCFYWELNFIHTSRQFFYV